MALVACGRYAVPFDEDGSVFYASDAFWDPDYSIIGIASSEHHYDLYPIGARDVEAAFRIVRSALAEYAGKLTGIALLQELLQEIHRGFGGINIHEHIAGLKFRRSPSFPEPANDPQARPRVQIALLELRGTHLSIACVGRRFSIYKVHPGEQELIFGWDRFSRAWAVVEPDPYSAFIWGHMDTAEEWATWETEVRSRGVKADLWDTEVKPGDLILVVTQCLVEIVHQARLDEFVKTTGCNPELVSHHLMTTVLRQAAQNESIGRPFVERAGAAWVVASME